VKNKQGQYTKEKQHKNNLPVNAAT